ncbi:MAG: hypothetical protein GF307_05750 [candidate division Zixibacteria bacterium]|nr:hypothetical protein [candidate division Zixibacteria bacterium]
MESEVQILSPRLKTRETPNLIRMQGIDLLLPVNTGKDFIIKEQAVLKLQDYPLNAVIYISLILITGALVIIQLMLGYPIESINLRDSSRLLVLAVIPAYAALAYLLFKALFPGTSYRYCCSNCGAKLEKISAFCPACKKSFDFSAIIPILKKGLKSRSLDTVWKATEDLEIIGPQAITAIPELIDNLHPNYDRKTRELSHKALLGITGQSDNGDDYALWREWWENNN